MPPPTYIPLRVSLPNTLRLARDPIQIFSEYVARYGQNYYLHVGGTRSSLITTDPDTIQHVLQRNHRNYRKSEIQADQLALYLGKGLLTNDGEDWLRQRRLIQPGFHRDRLAALPDLMLAVIDEEVDYLSRAARTGEPIDVYQRMLHTAFRIVARTLFSEDIADEDLARLGALITRLQEFVILPMRLPLVRPFLRWFGIQGHYQNLSRQAFSLLDELIDRRRESGHRRDDLLQMLLDARYEDTGEPMAPQRLLEELVILFVAGHETSANALSWTFYLLGEHPEHLAELRREWQTVLGEKRPSFADLRSLTYTTQVIEESMRLYPPAWITDRVALADDATEAFPIPAGTLVAPYIYGLHHHPDLWPEPEVFRPERFTAAAKKERHPYAYIPFGGGPRLCIGASFAMMEMQLVLVEVLRRFDLVLAPGAEVVPKALVTLRPRHGLPMILRERQ
ncbi:MAG: cytochrome P450 [Lewinella sp.]|nr:cytochrome P450 [Lewinella sp.]